MQFSAKKWETASADSLRGIVLKSSLVFLSLVKLKSWNVNVPIQLLLGLLRHSRIANFYQALTRHNRGTHVQPQRSIFHFTTDTICWKIGKNVCWCWFSDSEEGRWSKLYSWLVQSNVREMWLKDDNLIINYYVIPINRFAGHSYIFLNANSILNPKNAQPVDHCQN